MLTMYNRGLFFKGIVKMAWLRKITRTFCKRLQIGMSAVILSLLFAMPSYSYILNHDASSNDSTNSSSASVFSFSFKKRLVAFVKKTVDTLHYSYYKLGGSQFDSKRGIYVVDCSGYVDNILEAVNPDAYLSLVNSTGADKPTTQHYFDFFNRLGYRNNNYWKKIEDVEKLDAGDILVFRNTSRYRRTMGGHVMVVMDKPVWDDDYYQVRVADSAPSGHSKDTRSNDYSGIGIGTLFLKVNPKTGKPFAYAWKEGANWKRNVKFAMARPVET